MFKNLPNLFQVDVNAGGEKGGEMDKKIRQHGNIEHYEVVVKTNGSGDAGDAGYSKQMLYHRTDRVESLNKLCVSKVIECSEKNKSEIYFDNRIEALPIPEYVKDLIISTRYALLDDWFQDYYIVNESSD